MTSFDFAYYKPNSLHEAFECYHNLVSGNQSVLYFGGGTEIISMARAESITFDAVIDYKSIPECNVLSIEKDALVIGSAATLTAIAESGYFPLLGETVSRIADHTIQGKITLGGNLCSKIIYREAALPLMITNSTIKIMTKDGLRKLPFSQVFNGRLQLQQGDFVVQLLINRDDIKLPYNHIKRTKMDKIDYPLLSMAANKKNGKIKAAVSGVGNMPMLLTEEALNNPSMSEEDRISEIITQLSGHVISDIQGSSAYRMFVLRNILEQVFENFKGV